MKKLHLILLLSLLSFSAISAQNIQLHYFPNHSINSRMYDKNFVMVTFDMFKADKWGSFYTFIDFEFTGEKGRIGTTYWEISRNQNIRDLPVKLHLEYDGGVTKGGSIPGSYFVGANYPLTIRKFNLGANLSYKIHAFNHISHDAQLTLTWSGDILKNKLTLCGFIDMWTQNKNTETKSDEGKKFVVLFGPQGWYNINEKLAFGTKINISYNMLDKNKVFFFPSIAAKWNF